MRGLYEGGDRYEPTVCKEKGARQADAASCDINNIVKQFDKTGTLPMVDVNALYADVSTIGDYRSALEQVALADEYFMALPPKVRERFGNDPAEFLDFTSKPENRKELLEMLGLPADKPAEPAAIPPVVAPAPTKA